MTDLPRNDTEALAKGLILVATADSDAKRDLVTDICVGLVFNMSMKDIEKAKLYAAAYLAANHYDPRQNNEQDRI